MVSIVELVCIETVEMDIFQEKYSEEIVEMKNQYLNADYETKKSFLKTMFDNLIVDDIPDFLTQMLPSVILNCNYDSNIETLRLFQEFGANMNYNYNGDHIIYYLISLKYDNVYKMFIIMMNSNIETDMCVLIKCLLRNFTKYSFDMINHIIYPCNIKENKTVEIEYDYWLLSNVLSIIINLIEKNAFRNKNIDFNTSFNVFKFLFFQKKANDTIFNITHHFHKFCKMNISFYSNRYIDLILKYSDVNQRDYDGNLALFSYYESLKKIKPDDRKYTYALRVLNSIFQSTCINSIQQHEYRIYKEIGKIVRNTDFSIHSTQYRQ